MAPRFGGAHVSDEGDIAHGDLGLLPVRFDVWNRIVFVNLDGSADTLAQRLSSLSNRWQHFDFDLVRYGHGVSIEVDANWKLVTENFLESYHLPVVHRTLNRYSALEHHEVVIEADSHFGQRSTHYVPADAASGRLPVFPSLPPEHAASAEYLCLFPSTWLSVAADHFRVSMVEPLSPARTRIRWEFMFVGDEAMHDNHAQARRTLVERVFSVFEEDVPILERLQRGRESMAFDGGCFSPYHEQALARFQQLVLAHCNG